MKKKNEKEIRKSTFELYVLIFFPVISFLLYIIFNYIIVDFNLLLGLILTYICITMISIFYLVLLIKVLIENINNKESKDYFNNVFWIIILCLIFIFSMLGIINVVKDYINGTKEVIIVDYEVIKSGGKGPRIYKIIGYDEDGNKYKLKSRDYILEEDKSIKIIYYENVKMIKSFVDY